MKPDDAVLYMEICDLQEYNMMTDDAIRKVADDYNLAVEVVREVYERFEG